MNKKQLAIVTLVLSLFALTVTGCGLSQASTATAPSSNPTANISADESNLAGTSLDISIPALDETVDIISYEINPVGTYRREMLFDAMVGVTVARLEGISCNEEDIIARIINMSSTDIRDIVIIEDPSLTARLTYPAWRIAYTTGENEDTRQNTDIYVLTDEWNFYFHTAVPTDFAEEYNPIIESWIVSIGLTDAD